MKSSWLKPKWQANTCIRNIPIDYLIEQEIKVLLLDVDNTLLPRHERELNKSVVNWLVEASHLLKIHLISNNPSKNRIKRIAEQFSVGFTCRAAKPRRKKVVQVIDSYECKRSNIAIVGDRIFTDILVGNRLGLYTILVKPIKSDGTTNHNSCYQDIEICLSKLIGAK
tara:strand:+ start:503 stop:1006 length:504 start_codon:yes stop_codon:yes gene_type:complete